MSKLGEFKLEELTVDEAFHAVKEHLLGQQAQSVDDGVCAYKGPDELCCAAGIFVQDYSSNMEGGSWRNLVTKHGQTSRHEKLIHRFQVLHDNSTVDSWAEQLQSNKMKQHLAQARLDDEKWLDDKEHDSAAKRFRGIVKGANPITPVVIRFIEKGDLIIELSEDCGSSPYSRIFGVTVVNCKEKTKDDDLSRGFSHQKEAEAYIDSLPETS